MEVTHDFLADFKNFIVPIFRANYLATAIVFNSLITKLITFFIEKIVFYQTYFAILCYN